MKFLFHLNRLPQKAKVLIYGSGEAGSFVKSYLEEHRSDIEISYFLDTFRSGKKDGLEVIKIGDLEKDSNKFDFILICSAYWEEMKKTLKSLGVKNYLIIHPLVIEQNFQGQNYDVDAWRRKKGFFRGDWFFRWLSKKLLPFYYNTPFFYGQHEVFIGKGVSLSNTVFNSRSGRILIEDNVIFGHNVMLLTGVHDYSNKGGIRKTLENAGNDIIIGRNTWIASGAVIVGPVKIGRNSVVASGSMVTFNVPDGVVVGGNPAMVLKKINF